MIGNPNYADIIPKQFGTWVELPEETNQIVDPIQQDKIAHIYTSTLARTYLDKSTGREIMLSVAYGRDQDLDTQLHLPEMCYSSQGYKILSNKPHTIHTRFGDLPATELDTSYGATREPLTYFIRVGDQVARGSKARNLARIRMALRGYLIDGLLFRISEDTSAPDAHALQDKFVRDLLDALTPQAREKVIGSTEK